VKIGGLIGTLRSDDLYLLLHTAICSQLIYSHGPTHLLLVCCRFEQKATIISQQILVNVDKHKIMMQMEVYCKTVSLRAFMNTS